jgi:hypothetical protein
MFQSILSKNMGAINVFMKQAPVFARNHVKSLGLAVPIGSFVLWAAWPAAGDTLMGRNQEVEK